MLGRRALIALTGATVSCGGTGISPEVADEAADEGWQRFTVEQMNAQRAERGTSYFEAMATERFTMGLLHARAGDEVGLIDHADNVVYHIATGVATLSTVDTSHVVGAGGVAFVKGSVEHRFHEITADLAIVSVFATAFPAPSDPDIVTFTLADMVVDRAGEGNVWIPLLFTSTMNVGMYMLPKGRGDETIMWHDFAEFKVVVNGVGRFDVGAHAGSVEPGSVTYVEDDTQHQIHRVADDLDVLVIWGN